MFFDPKYPRISDPGGYFSIAREGDQLLVKVGNHGWSSNWKTEIRERLTEYLWGCRLFNADRKHDHLNAYVRDDTQRRIETDPVFLRQFENRLEEISAASQGEGIDD